MEFILVGIGCGLGAMGRFFLSVHLRQRWQFPLGTFWANIIGSMLLGVFYGMTVLQGTQALIFLTTGFCGGFTTFSTFSHEVVLQLRATAYRQAFFYAVLSIGGSLTAVIVGLSLVTLIN